MKKLLVCFAALATILFMVACGGDNKGRGKNNNGNSSGTSVCSYGTYECHGNDSYFCGYPDSSNDLIWMLAEKCNNGCDEQTGKCNIDSEENNNSDSGETESDDNNDSGESTIIGECTGLPENAEWNSVSIITQTWNGSSWVPPLAGTYNEKASETECRFKCISGYKWTGSKCVDPNCGHDSYTPCTDPTSGLIWSSRKDAVTSWESAVSYCNNLNEGGFTDWHLPTISELRTLIQNCSGTVSGGPCKVTDDCLSSECINDPCKSCDSDKTGTYSKFGETDQFFSSSTKSDSADQAWIVVFRNAKVTFSFKNYLDYHVSDEKINIRCVRYDNKTRESYCNNLPENAEWNTVSTITQTLVGNEWTPTTAGIFNETASDSECRFKCFENYTWDGSDCKNGIRESECDPKPENSVWNDNGAEGTFQQTWDGNDWIPENHETIFSKTQGNQGDCVFKCDTGFYWDENICKIAPTKEEFCSDLPENAEWNEVSNITQTWDGDDWIPSNITSYNEIPSFTECRFKCETNYTWDGSSCANDIREAGCDPKPENSVWNDNGSEGTFIQTWTGVEWTPENYAATYNTSAGVCHFKCSENYNWDSSNLTCEPATRKVKCADLPANATWNTVSSITQTWDGSKWIPETTNGISYYCIQGDCTYPQTKAVYDETASTSQCHFKCKNFYKWENSKCIPKIECDPLKSYKRPCIDYSNGLMWSEKDYSYKSIDNPMEYCTNLNANDYSDWYLPTLNEIYSSLIPADERPTNSFGYTIYTILGDITGFQLQSSTMGQSGPGEMSAYCFACYDNISCGEGFCPPDHLLVRCVRKAW